MSAFVEAFDQVLERAYAEGASDIHIEPRREALVVRFRVDGRMKVVHEVVELEQRRRWFEVIKRQCRLDTGRLLVPQDVRFRSEQPPCDFRVALVPGVHGEKLVLRLLPRSVSFDLSSYKMPVDAKADLQLALGKRDGLVIVSGPTGSGKTTLLYNALAALDPRERTIYTLEDPVEYELPGLWQCAVDAARGVGFRELLRSMMRADPDVMLVGEVRDAETAAAALHAAKTGHLVLTTVHANSAAGVADRLFDLGITPEVYLATTRFVSAQRLLPRVCESCRVPDDEGLKLLKAAVGEVEAAFKGEGCSACGGLGTKGRVLLMGWEARLIGANGESSLVPRQTLNDAVRRAAEQGVVRASDAAAG